MGGKRTLVNHGNWPAMSYRATTKKALWEAHALHASLADHSPSADLRLVAFILPRWSCSTS
jgi:hypothetical protein